MTSEEITKFMAELRERRSQMKAKRAGLGSDGKPLFEVVKVMTYDIEEDTLT